MKAKLLACAALLSLAGSAIASEKLNNPVCESIENMQFNYRTVEALSAVGTTRNLTDDSDYALTSTKVEQAGLDKLIYADLIQNSDGATVAKVKMGVSMSGTNTGNSCKWESPRSIYYGGCKNEGGDLIC